MDAVYYMKKALREAAKAAAEGEVPVGAVVVKDGIVIARAHNKKIAARDALRHAEMLALQKAMRKTGSPYLQDAALYVTLEPCPMCAGAVINARIGKLYYGAKDPKAGCCGSLYNLPEDSRFNHRPAVTGGVMEEECGKILTDFFKERRKQKENGEC